MMGNSPGVQEQYIQRYYYFYAEIKRHVAALQIGLSRVRLMHPNMVLDVEMFQRIPKNLDMFDSYNLKDFAMLF